MLVFNILVMVIGDTIIRELLFEPDVWKFVIITIISPQGVVNEDWKWLYNIFIFYSVLSSLCILLQLIQIILNTTHWWRWFDRILSVYIHIQKWKTLLQHFKIEEKGKIIQEIRISFGRKKNKNIPCLDQKVRSCNSLTLCRNPCQFISHVVYFLLLLYTFIVLMSCIISILELSANTGNFRL